MVHSNKPAWTATSLSVIVLLAAVILLTRSPISGVVQAQNGSQGADPVKDTRQVSAPVALQPTDSYFVSQGLVFVPVNSGTQYQSGIGGCRSTNVTTDWFADVNIPEGSLVSRLEFVYNNIPESGAVVDSNLCLMVATDTGGWGATQHCVTGTYDGSGTQIQSVDLSWPINKFHEGYTFMWRSKGPTQQLCQARLYYRAPMWLATYVPIVVK
jgi:hypothetical protein